MLGCRQKKWRIKLKKVLFVATVTKHINAFHIPYLKSFKEQGYEVHVASKGNEEIEYCDKHFDLPFERFPVKRNNLKTYKELKKIIEENNYSIIHCHTPVGGVLTRLAAKKARKKGTRVIYTAHGFHFYKGAPLINWLLFYPVEWYLAKYTDTLITINKEDFERAKNKFGKRCKDIQYVSGVGIDTKKFNIETNNEERKKLKESIGLKNEDFVLTCVARLDKNKNQVLLIECMKQLIKNHNNIHLLLVGSDELNGYYQNLVKEKCLENNIHFLGQRKDIPQILKITDVAISVSKREGFGLNLAEALISEVPVIGTNNRGHREIIENGINGFIIENNVDELKKKIDILYSDNKEYNKIKSNCYNSSKKFYIDNSLKIIKGIYKI